MQIVRELLHLSSGIITIYSFIIIFRILLTWFRGFDFGGPWRFICSITDPYLNLFRGIRFLQLGSMDLSPVLGIILLQILASILKYAAITGMLTPLTILTAVALAVWQTIISILIFFGIIAAIRFVSIVFMRGPAGGFFFVLDSILEPFTLAVRKCVPGGRNLTYPRALMIMAILITIICVLGLIFVEPLILSLFGLSLG